MSAGEATREDLSALSREDLVYKAKLAEQAERCARAMRAGDRSGARARGRGGWTPIERGRACGVGWGGRRRRTLA